MRRWLFADVNSTLGGVESTLRGVESTLRGVESTLGGVESTLRGVESTLQEIGRTLERMDQRMDREFKLTRASVENNTQVTRAILLELRDHRPILEHIDRGVQSNTEGLMHVLDELRNGGPGTAPAV